MNTTTDYHEQANKFAKKHGIKLAILDEDYRPYFPGEKESRSVFKLRLTRNKKSYTFAFGQSINNTGIGPTMYDVLACLTKYDIGSYGDFCFEFGYDEDSRTGERTYKAVLKEFAAVERLFSDILDDLQEIQ